MVETPLLFLPLALAASPVVTENKFADEAVLPSAVVGDGANLVRTTVASVISGNAVAGGVSVVFTDVDPLVADMVESGVWLTVPDS